MGSTVHEDHKKVYVIQCTLTRCLGLSIGRGGSPVALSGSTVTCDCRK